MEYENCPKCSQELTTLQSSGRQICRSCGWTSEASTHKSKNSASFFDSFNRSQFFQLNKSLLLIPVVLFAVIVIATLAMNKQKDTFPRDKKVDVIREGEDITVSQLKNTRTIKKFRLEENQTVLLTNKSFEICHPTKDNYIGREIPSWLSQEELEEIDCSNYDIYEWDNNRFLGKYDNISGNVGFEDVCEIEGNTINCISLLKEAPSEAFANPKDYPQYHTDQKTYILKK